MEFTGTITCPGCGHKITARIIVPGNVDVGKEFSTTTRCDECSDKFAVTGTVDGYHLDGEAAVSAETTFLH